MVLIVKGGRPKVNQSNVRVLDHSDVLLLQRGREKIEREREGEARERERGKERIERERGRERIERERGREHKCTHFSCIIVDVKVRGDKENVFWLQICVSESCAVEICREGRVG